MLSKSEKKQLIEIEKCERSAGRMKLEDDLNKQRETIEGPYNKSLERVRRERDKALMDAGLFWISLGCGKTHPVLEEYNIETNRRIKAILRE